MVATCTASLRLEKTTNKNMHSRGNTATYHYANVPLLCGIAARHCRICSFSRHCRKFFDESTRSKAPKIRIAIIALQQRETRIGLLPSGIVAYT